MSKMTPVMCSREGWGDVSDAMMWMFSGGRLLF